MKNKKTKSKPIMIKGMSFNEMIQDVMSHNEQIKKHFKESDGVCHSCKKDKAVLYNDPDIINHMLENKITDVYMCKKCNEKTEKLLEELRKDSGFMQIRF